MGVLRVFEDTQPEQFELFKDGPAIQKQLEQAGIRFEQWSLKTLSDATDTNEILKVYSEDIERIKKESGFKAVDIVALTPEHPKKAQLRAMFLDEHTHQEFEIRFFVEGSGQFNIHTQQKVFQVTCEAGDLISVPTDVPHWFDMGPNPRFTAIRFFTNPEGWQAHWTPSDIAAKFPRYE